MNEPNEPLLTSGPSPLDTGTVVTSARFCHQFPLSSYCEMLITPLICTALAFWLTPPGLACALKVLFSHTYCLEMTFTLIKFVRVQLSFANSDLTRERERAVSVRPCVHVHAVWRLVNIMSHVFTVPYSLCPQPQQGILVFLLLFFCFFL